MSDAKLTLDPHSTAAILLREFATAETARSYAIRLARQCEHAGALAMAEDYSRAAEDLRLVIAGMMRYPA